MSNYYYLDVSLELVNPQQADITPAFLKKNIVEAVKELFGEVNAAVTIDLLKYNPQNNQHFKQKVGIIIIKMSHCRRLGPNNKDIVIFATKENHQIPSTVKLPEPDPQPGLILANGDINWNCPCLGGMATGPCGVEFRNAFSCFHYSDAEPKGSDCYDLFKTMQACMQQYPTLYNKDLGDDEDMPSLDKMESATTSSSEGHVLETKSTK